MSDEFDFDLEGFEEDLKDTLDTQGDLTIEKYSEYLEGLNSLSNDEIDAVTPDSTSKEVYEQLQAVVAEASQQNLNQAELKSKIESLGGVAVTIAKRVAGLAKFLA